MDATSIDLESLPELLKTQSIKLTTAFLVLIVGWLIALIISGFARKAVRQVGINEMMAKSGGPSKLEFDKWIARGIFYTLMILVFMGFFEVIGLSIVSEPLNHFLIKLFEYAPRLIGPVVLLAVAWVVATVLRFLLIRGMGGNFVNNFFEKTLGLEGTFQKSVAITLGNTIYWVVFLLFSIAVLEALDLNGLLGPLQEMLSQILNFLPNVVAALLILGFGWFIARIIQKIVTNILTTVGTDRLSERLGFQIALGRQSMSALVGTIAHITVMIPVLIASLNALKLDAITQPASDMLSRFLVGLPSIFAALLVLFLAYLIGRMLSVMVSNLLTSVGFDRILAQAGFGQDPHDYNTMLSKLGIGDKPAEGKRTPSELVGTIIVILVLMFAAIEALALVGFEALAGLLTQFMIFIGEVFLGLVIFAIGLFLSNWAAKTIRNNGSSQSTILAVVTRISILVLAGAMALQQMGLAEQIINLAFGILLGAVALSAALSFGLGGREVAANILQDVVRHLETKRMQDGPPKVD